MEKETIRIAIKDFSSDPGPRYSIQGDDAGEDFYHKVLNEAFYNALHSERKLLITLDGTEGYASSFLDESFGNLVYDFTLEKVKNNLIIESKEEPHWKKMIIEESFLQWEDRRKENIEPKKTIEHDPWYRYCDGQLEKEQWCKVNNS